MKRKAAEHSFRRREEKKKAKTPQQQGEKGVHPPTRSGKRETMFYRQPGRRNTEKDISTPGRRGGRDPQGEKEALNFSPGEGEEGIRKRFLPSIFVARREKERAATTFSSLRRESIREKKAFPPS